MASKKTDIEVERRVNMARMADQINEIHCEIFDKENGLCKRMTKAENNILQIKTVWSTVTVIATTVFHYLTRKG